MANYNCLKCGKPVEEAAAKCGSCGSDAAAMKVELEKRENERLMQEIFATDRQAENEARARRAAAQAQQPAAKEVEAPRAAGAAPRAATAAVRGGLSAGDEINKFRKEAGLVSEEVPQDSKYPFLAPGILFKGTAVIAMLVWCVGFSGRPFAESALTLGVITLAVAAVAVIVDFVRYGARAKSA